MMRKFKFYIDYDKEEKGSMRKIRSSYMGASASISISACINKLHNRILPNINTSEPIRNTNNTE